MGVERAEGRGEGGMLFIGQRLVAEEHDLVAQQGGADRVALSGGKRPAEIDAVDFGADGRLQGADADDPIGAVQNICCCGGHIITFQGRRTISVQDHC